MRVLTGPVRNFGDDPYVDWTVVVKQLGGSVSSWPFNTGLYGKLYGRPAARFDAARYVAASKTRLLDFTAPTQASSNNQYFYVLAPAAVAASPQAHTMTAAEQAKNAIFTNLDKGADALGLPSLDGINNFIKSLGRDAVIIGGVIVLAWWMLNRSARRD